jgi:hypothetical protein
MKGNGMIAVLIGIALIITAVILWLGGLTLAHAVAILIGLVGVLLLLYWALPATAYARRTP